MVTVRSLTTKLSLGVVLLVLLSVGLMAGLAVWRSGAALRERALATNQTVALGVSFAVEQYVTDAVAVMREAAERPKLRQEITSGNWPEARTVLENVARHFQQLDYVFVQDAQGIIRARVPHAETVGQDFSFRDFFRQALETRRPYLSGLYVSKAAQRPVVAIAAPVLHADGRVAGVLVGALSLHAMSRLVSVAAHDDGRAIQLVDGQGQLIADSGAAVESVHDLRAEPVVQAVLSGRAGTMVFRGLGHGQEMLGAYAPVKPFGWGVVVTRPTAAAQAPAARLGAALIWTALGCTAGAIAVGVGFARRLTRPLLRLDITERKQLEAQLRQAQKLEAIGQLAGGVAHDFNNLLTVIGGRSSLLLQKLHPDDPACKDVELIEKTAQRAAGLTRQLLAFSRKQVLDPKPLNLNALVAGVVPMLRRLIGEHIEVVTVPGGGLGHVMADPGQVEQVVMNLVVNARDAMPDGGMVTIQTANRKLQETALHAQGHVPPGQYASVSVQDTGCGMDSLTLARIFEPFFTTKEPGKGTGLGLSTVHGIVHQSGGYIGVDSAPGRGTTFTIYLPQITDPVEVTHIPATSPRDLMRGTEVILLVEDEDEVRRVASEVLRTCGYTVLETSDPLEALTIAERQNRAIGLTDLVMPAMRGSELAQRLRTTCPRMRVLYMSGYTNEMIEAASASEPARAFLHKPFTPHDLARKVREVLARH